MPRSPTQPGALKWTLTRIGQRLDRRRGYCSYYYSYGYGYEAGYQSRLKNYWRKENEHQISLLPPPPPSPPELAFRLVCFFAPPKIREAVLGDFEQAFLDNVDAIGIQAARYSYRYQVFASLAGFAWERVLELLHAQRSRT